MKDKRVASSSGREGEVQDMARETREILGIGVSKGMGYQAESWEEHRLHVREG